MTTSGPSWSPSSPAPRASRLAVVIPARNEERRLPRCLDALEAAEKALQSTEPDFEPTLLVVVLDRCTDRSLEVLRRHRTSPRVVISQHGRVGAARAMGVRETLQGRHGCIPRWIACTDADSAVPADWLITQAEHARAGTDLLLGLVRPDPAEMSQQLLHRWKLAHHLADGHPHVHGANLGISTSMYLRVGGFEEVEMHEDVMLAQRVRLAGGRVVSTASSPVLTSSRRSGRTSAGMAGYLSQLERDDELTSSAREAG